MSDSKVVRLSGSVISKLEEYRNSLIEFNESNDMSGELYRNLSYDDLILSLYSDFKYAKKPAQNIVKKFLNLLIDLWERLFPTFP